MINHNYSTDRLLGSLDELFTQTLRNFGAPQATSNLRGSFNEKDDHYILQADLPGFTKEEVSLSLEKHTVTIEARSERDDAFRKEAKGSYELPEDTNLTEIDAKLENGVLTILCRKLNAEEAKPRKIEIA